MMFNIEFFDSVLSDWNYKEVYVNDICIYSVASDTQVTMRDFRERLTSINNVTSVVWKGISITPFDTDDGVVLKFHIGVEFWK
jgi:hypothetical protein